MIRILLIILITFSACNKNRKNNSLKGKEGSDLNFDINTQDFNSDFKLFNFGGKSYKANKRTKKLSNIYYTATWLPNEYYIKKNLGVKDNDSLLSYEKELEKELIVQFEFQEESSKDLFNNDFVNLNYKSTVEYMAFKIKNDFFAIDSASDTIACSGVLFERNFQVAPYKKILLYFKGVDKSKSIKLIYSDRLFDNGLIKFYFQPEK